MLEANAPFIRCGLLASWGSGAITPIDDQGFRVANGQKFWNFHFHSSSCCDEPIEMDLSLDTIICSSSKLIQTVRASTLWARNKATHGPSGSASSFLGSRYIADRHS